MKTRDLALVPPIAVGGVLLSLGYLAHADWAFIPGASLLTLASLEVSRRFWRWSRRVEISRAGGAGLNPWHIRPGYLTAYLVTAGVLAAMFVDVGELYYGLLVYPAAVVLLAFWMGRARLPGLIWDVMDPDRTHPRPDS